MNLLSVTLPMPDIVAFKPTFEPPWAYDIIEVHSRWFCCTLFLCDGKVSQYNPDVSDEWGGSLWMILLRGNVSFYLQGEAHLWWLYSGNSLTYNKREVLQRGVTDDLLCCPLGAGEDHSPWGGAGLLQNCSLWEGVRQEKSHLEHWFYHCSIVC